MKYLLAVCIFIMVIADPIDSSGGDLEIGGFGLGRSHHTNRDQDFNETHSMWIVEANDVQLVKYNNSNRNRGYMLAYSPEYFLGNHLCAGYTVGLVSGYVDDHIEQAVPFIMPKLCAKIGPLQVDVHTIPTVIDWEIHFSLKVGEVSDFPSKPVTDFAVGYGYGTLGPQYSVLYNFAKGWDVRISGGKTDYEWFDQWPDYHMVQTETVDLGGYGLFVDYYPFNWDVGIYGGLMYNEFKYKTRYSWNGWITPGASAWIDGKPYPADGFEYLEGRADWDSFSPAAGIRFGNPWRKGRRCSFYTDLGVVRVRGLSGETSYSVPAVHGNPALKGKLDQELHKWVRDNVEKYDKYSLMPRVEAGFNCAI